MSVFTDILELLGIVSAAPAPAAPKPLPVAWMGVDRKDIPGAPPAANANPDWLGLLIDNSNLRFCGAYLEGPPLPPPASPGDFTNSTKAVSRAWIPNITTMRGQGWGIVFWYFGYSIGGGEPLPAGGADAARGQLHARHAKTIVSTIAPELDGAVVYLDNEDAFDANLAPLQAYYGGFFDELERPDPVLPSLRIGLYAHKRDAEQFVRNRPQLFVWEVTLDTQATNNAPFNANDNPLHVDPARPLGAFQVSIGAAAQKWYAFPVGRQFRFYSGNMPLAGALTAAVPALTPIADWDYDSSAVRDPSYPEAEPRLALAPGPIVIAGRFQTRAAGGGGAPPQMIVDRLEAGGRTNVPAVANKYVEPDAPIASATFSGSTRSDFATLLTSGDIALFTNNAGAWSTVDTISAAPAMRRLRALAFVAFAADDRQLFFAGNDRHLYGIRQQGAAAWTAPAQIGGVTLHPFSEIAVATRSATTVELFAINDAGLLSNAWWSPAGAAPWPPSNLLTLETAPSLLSGTALAAVSAEVRKLHVFGVGADLRLRYVEFTDTSGWGAVTAMGSANELVCPHTRLAAHAPSATRVEVVALSDRGRPRIYALEVTAGAWTEQPRVDIDDPADTAPAGYVPPPPASPTETAYGWRVNPYGDLAIGQMGGTTTIFAAGIKPGQTAAMRRSTAAGSAWEFYR